MSAESKAVEHFRARVVQDALAEASSDHWLRRAATLEVARPRQGDFHGQATRDALQARWDRLTEQAQACRAAARVALIRYGGLTADELAGFVVAVPREGAVHHDGEGAVHHDGDEVLVDRPHDGDGGPNRTAISAGAA